MAATMAARRPSVLVVLGVRAICEYFWLIDQIIVAVRAWAGWIAHNLVIQPNIEECLMRRPYGFESSDSLAQWSAWLNHIFITGMATLLSFPLTGWMFACAVLVLCTLHIAGLRASIDVTDVEVVIRKKWFFIPYKTYRASEITDVWYGGDWGLEDGAIGVVVALAGEEVHIGTRLNMGELHAALSPLVSSNRTPVSAA